MFQRLKTATHHAAAIAGLLALLAGAPSPAVALEIPVTARTLGNGLRVLVHPDHSLPILSLYVFYRVGSRNERTGATGVAHLFEHMMFNGSEKYPGESFDRIVESNGGSSNGYTTRDFTAYQLDLRKESLALALDLEADRMRALAITPQNLEQERKIVKEERRLRTEDDVGGALSELLYLTAFQQSSYRWDTVGFMSDLDAITLDEARAFFRTYYVPSNAVLVLAGDVEPDDAMRAVEAAFDAIPSGSAPPPVRSSEPEQRGERRAELHRSAELPALTIAYKAVPAFHPDRPALDVLSALLSQGESSRLYRDLVYRREIATDVDASFEWALDQELFTIYAQARPGHTTAELEKAIDGEIAQLASSPVPAAEIEKVRNELRSSDVRRLATLSGKANQLGLFEVIFGDYRRMFSAVDDQIAVRPEDVQRVTRTYLVPERRTVVTLVPE
jgi:predicted Zn-dependent peptidase